MLSIDDYLALDGLGLAGLIRSGDVTTEEVLDTAINRCEAVNGSINAVVIEMFDAARASLAAGVPDGPFRGVPFLLKDLGAYYAGYPTTYGCRLLRGQRARSRLGDRAPLQGGRPGDLR